MMKNGAAIMEVDSVLATIVDHLLNGIIQAGGYVVKVDVFIHVGQPAEGIFQRVAARHQFICGNAYRDGEVPPQTFPGFLKNALQKPRPVFRASAEFIRAVIGGRGDELADQIAVTRMDFNSVKSGHLRPLTGIRVFSHQCIHFFGTQRSGNNAAGLAGNIARRDRLLPDPRRYCGAARMVDLNGDLASPCVNLFGKLVHMRDKAVMVKTQLCGAV